eukprot:6455516-Ditylum_brightwellii.AAC.1
MKTDGTENFKAAKNEKSKKKVMADLSFEVDDVGRIKNVEKLKAIRKWLLSKKSKAMRKWLRIQVSVLMRLVGRSELGASIQMKC